MAASFMRWRHFMALAVCCLSVRNALAVSVSVAGLFPGKALLVVDGGAPRAVAAGQTTPEGVRVVAIDGEAVTLEVAGQKRVLRVGQNVASQNTANGGARAGETTLHADMHGQYYVNGMISEQPVRFLVDTGATLIVIGVAEAERLGLDWHGGEQFTVVTANGVVRAARVRFDTVRVGDVVLQGVDGAVVPASMPVALLGMSFLRRLEIANDGATMTLKKRF